MSGHNRLTELKPHAISESGIGTNRASTTSGPGGKFTYTIDPASRYAGLPIDLPPRPEMELEEMVEAGMIEQAEVEDNFGSDQRERVCVCVCEYSEQASER